LNEDEEAHEQEGNGFHHLSETAQAVSQFGGLLAASDAGHDSHQHLRIGDLCPECGQAAVVNEEGCRKCYACGYSEC
jgi:hypothetical protein